MFQKYQDVYACLVDYQKAFYRVKQEMMVKILIEAAADVEEVHTEYMKIKQLVQQGCTLLIFNL